MPNDAPNHSTNQRVSNALLGQKMDMLATAQVDGFSSVNKRLDTIEDRQLTTDVDNATSAEWRRQHEKDHDAQRKSTRTETIAAAVTAALLGIGVKLPWQGP